MTEGKTMRELRAIIRRDHERFSKLAVLWGELTEEYQDELLALAAKRSAELDAQDEETGA